MLGPDSGSQACGEIGAGRMLEPEEIVASLTSLPSARHLQDINVLSTAGPAQEIIDPARYTALPALNL